MKKRAVCLLSALVFALAASVAAFPAFEASSVSEADFVAPVIEIPETLVVPDNDMLTDDVSYILGQGSRYEIKVHVLFVDPTHNNREGLINHQKYICIHNTDNYSKGAGAAANGGYCRGAGTSVSWHFSVGNDGIEQQLPVNEKGIHAGGGYWGSMSDEEKLANGWYPEASNYSTIGIETCDNGFPSNPPYAIELWDTPAMYNWYATQYDLTATYLAMHVASLCVRLNFNPYTQICQHNSSSGKNCPSKFRYVFGTYPPKFTHYGTYYKIFLDRMHDYYRAFGGSYIETDEYVNEYYNPDSVVYRKGLYRVPADTKAYRAGNVGTGEVGTVATGSIVDVKIVGYDWGKVVLADGTVGWIALKDLSYIGGEHDYGTYRSAAGDIVEVTKIDGNTAYYEGGSADIAALTRVYKVEVKGDTAFGAEPKYMASGESFTVTAAAPEAPFFFDMWETTNGVAAIADREAETTKVTVLNSDIGLKSTYRDKYYLKVVDGSGSGWYDEGTVVEVEAMELFGSKFLKWGMEGKGKFDNFKTSKTTFVTGSTDTVLTPKYEESNFINLNKLENYAAGKSYVTTWKGSADIAYKSEQTGDPELKKLTDGETAAAEFAESPLYVAFEGEGETATITIDLVKCYEVKRVVLRDIAQKGSFKNIDKSGISVEYSENGVNFAPAKDVMDTLYYSYTRDGGVTTKYKSIYTHCLDFVKAKARYVRVSFVSAGSATSISEAEVYGKSGQAGEEPTAAVLGDVNSDGEIDNLDASLVLRYDAGLDAAKPQNADVNNDGEIDNLDAALLLQYDAGLIDKFQ